VVQRDTKGIGQACRNQETRGPKLKFHPTADGVTDATFGKSKLPRTVIGIPPEIQRTAVIVYTIIGADGEAPHALGLIVIHAHVAKWDQPGISIKGIVTGLGRGIVARHQEIEVVNLVKATWFPRHVDGWRSQK
jgi:hypothetical protein